MKPIPPKYLEIQTLTKTKIKSPNTCEATKPGKNFVTLPIPKPSIRALFSYSIVSGVNGDDEVTTDSMANQLRISSKINKTQQLVKQMAVYNWLHDSSSDKCIDFDLKKWFTYQMTS